MAGLGDGVLGLPIELGIDVPFPIRAGARLHIRPVIDEFPDRDSLRQLFHAAEMVGVVMRQNQMIDLGQTRVAHGVHDAADVAHRPVEVAGVDQNRLAGRRYE